MLKDRFTWMKTARLSTTTSTLPTFSRRHELPATTKPRLSSLVIEQSISGRVIFVKVIIYLLVAIVGVRVVAHPIVPTVIILISIVVVIVSVVATKLS
jgi:hypothetical protein